MEVPGSLKMDRNIQMGLEWTGMAVENRLHRSENGQHRDGMDNLRTISSLSQRENIRRCSRKRYAKT